VPRKRLQYDKTKAVKAIARKRVGAPSAARALDEKAVRTKPKYKKAWSEEE